MKGPIQFDAKIHFVHPETGATAVVTYGFAPGKIPTDEDIDKAFHRAHAAVSEVGMKLMGEDTFFNAVIVKEKTGRVGNFATPSEFSFPEDLDTAELDLRSNHDEDEDEG